MDSKLFVQAISKFLMGLVLVGILIFLPAGTLAYWQGWLLMGILFVPMFIAGLVMMAKSPDLLRKRLNAKEEQDEQKAVLLLSGLMFLALPLVLGSVISFVIMLLYIPIIAKRIANEEEVLVEGLEGYAAYRERVKYKVVPFIW